MITCMKCRGQMEDFSPSQGELWWICGCCGHAVLADPETTMAQAMDSLAAMYAQAEIRAESKMRKNLRGRVFGEPPCDVEG